MIWTDIKDCSIQDLEHLIKTYQNNQGAVERLDLDIMDRHAQMNPSPGWIIVVSKDKHDRTAERDARAFQLQLEIDQLEAEKEPYERKIAIVDELLRQIANNGTQEEYDMVVAVTRGVFYHQLARKYNYSDKSAMRKRIRSIIRNIKHC